MPANGPTSIDEVDMVSVIEWLDARGRTATVVKAKNMVNALQLGEGHHPCSPAFDHEPGPIDSQLAGVALSNLAEQGVIDYHRDPGDFPLAYRIPDDIRDRAARAGYDIDTAHLYGNELYD